MDPIVIRQSPGKMIKVVLASLLLDGLSFLCLTIGILNDRLFLLLAGGFGALLFMPCTVYLFWRAIHPKAVMTIDDSGITDNSSAIAVGFIPWSQITAIQLTPHMSQVYFSIRVLNVESLLKSLSPKTRKLIRMNMSMGLPPVNIQFNTTATPVTAAFDWASTVFKRHQNPAAPRY